MAIKKLTIVVQHGETKCDRCESLFVKIIENKRKVA